jgi:hypothetical protein
LDPGLELASSNELKVDVFSRRSNQRATVSFPLGLDLSSQVGISVALVAGLSGGGTALVAGRVASAGIEGTGWSAAFSQSTTGEDAGPCVAGFNQSGSGTAGFATADGGAGSTGFP